MPPSPQNPIGTDGSILLVEEYEALASAFGSALQKFAGGYQTHVVRSLPEAERLLATVSPQLLVLDFDPPPHGSVAFFKRLKSTLPEARVLIVSAAEMPDLADEPLGRLAFSFIEKPFELAQFGQVIEGLIGDKEPRASGTLSDLSLFDMILLYAAIGATMVLQVEASRGRSGEIHFSDGRISHAAVMGRSGVEALQTILRWPSPRFNEAERRTDAPRSIQGAWAPVLIEALKAAEASRARAADAGLGTSEATRIMGKKIVIVDDTELLSIFLEEILISADPTLEIVMAPSGLQGLQLTEATMPDLLLLDYSLPDINGGEVCRRLLANEATAGIPIIMMSGHVPEMAKVAQTFDNVIATIAKPFLSEAFVQLIERTLADLPKLKDRRRKKRSAPQTAPEKIAPIETPHKSPNGRRKPSKSPSRTAIPSPKTAPIPEPEELPVEPEAKKEVATEVVVQAHTPEVAQRKETTPIPEPIEEPPAVEQKPASPVELETPKNQPEQAPVPEELPPDVEAVSPTAPAVEEEIREPDPVPPSIAEPEAMIPPENFPRPSSEISPIEGVPVGIHAAKLNAIVVGFPLEVFSIQFSPSLQIKSIRARLFSSAVTLHVLPQALPGIPIPDAMFELAHVELDQHGRLGSIRLAPSNMPVPANRRHHLAIDGVILEPGIGGEILELTPTAVAPMRMQLLALFELARVELDPAFGVAFLVLKARADKTRLTFLPDVAQTGATFEVGNVSVDGGRISEILLHAV